MTAKLNFPDLTAITAPFGLLDDDTQQRLRAWSHGLEVLYFTNEWVSTPIPSFSSHLTYRARPVPLVPDYVDWSQVGPGVNWIARDTSVTGFTRKPIFTPSALWTRNGGRMVLEADRLFQSYRRGTVAPCDSLISRPGVTE